MILEINKNLLIQEATGILEESNHTGDAKLDKRAAAKKNIHEFRKVTHERTKKANEIKAKRAAAKKLEKTNEKIRKDGAGIKFSDKTKALKDSIDRGFRGSMKRYKRNIADIKLEKTRTLLNAGTKKTGEEFNKLYNEARAISSGNKIPVGKETKKFALPAHRENKNGTQINTRASVSKNLDEVDPELRYKY